MSFLVILIAMKRGRGVSDLALFSTSFFPALLLVLLLA